MSSAAGSDDRASTSKSAAAAARMTAVTADTAGENKSVLGVLTVLARFVLYGQLTEHGYTPAFLICSGVASDSCVNYFNRGERVTDCVRLKPRQSHWHTFVFTL